MEQEYTISPGMKIFYAVLALAAFSFSMFVLTPVKQNALVVWLFSLFLMAVALLIVVNLLKRKVVISEHSILCISLFSRKELDLAAIQGYRIGKKVIYLEPVATGDPTITIRNYTDLSKSRELARWVKAAFEDLDAIDLENQRKEVLQNEAWGSTEDERSGNLAKAKNITIAYNVVGLLLGFVLIFSNDKNIVLLLLAYPLIGVALMIFSKGMIKFTSGPKRSVNGYILLGVSLPSFMLLIKSLEEYTLFRYDHFWLPVILTSTVLFALYYIPGVNRSMKFVRTQMGVMIVFALLYGFGSIRQINCAFDDSNPRIYEATVLRHRVSRGKSTTYILTLGPWGSDSGGQEVDVRRSLYDAVGIGSTIRVQLREGLLGIPWFVVTR
jgi:hypothetical protein